VAASSRAVNSFADATVLPERLATWWLKPGGLSASAAGHGCWERYASGGGLGRMTRVAARAGKFPKLVARVGGDPEKLRSEDVTEAAAEGIDEAVGMMREVGWWLARGSPT